MRHATLEKYPILGEVFGTLAGRISEEKMRQLNYAVDGQHRDVKAVAREFINGLGGER